MSQSRTRKFERFALGPFLGLVAFALRRPWLTIFLALAVTLAAAPGCLRLKLRTDGHALVGEDAPAVRLDREIRDTFGLRDLMVVLIRGTSKDGIFTPAGVQLIRDLTAEISQLPGIDKPNLSSLATEPNFRLRPGSLQFQTMLEPALTNEQQLAQLRDDLNRIQLYTGTLLSFDGNATCILAGVPPGADRTELFNRLRQIVDGRRTPGFKLDLVGAPVAEALLGVHILEDLGVPPSLLGVSLRGSKPTGVPASFYQFRVWIAHYMGLVPIAIGVMAFIFFLSFRKLAPTLLPLMEVGACLAFVFGLMGWFGVPVYLTTAVLPVILTAMGVCDEIYIFSRYATLAQMHPEQSNSELLTRAMEEIIAAVVLMSLTTAIGFLSFAFSPLAPVRAFGIYTSLGILFCMVWSITVIPASLQLLPRRWLMPAIKKGRTRTDTPNPLRQIVGLLVRHPGKGVALTLLLAALLPFGLKRVKIQDSWIDGFAPESSFREATAYLNRQFHGAHLLLVNLKSDLVGWKGELSGADIEGNVFRLPSTITADLDALKGSAFTVQRVLPTNDLPLRSQHLYMPWQSWTQTAYRSNNATYVTTPVQEGSPKFWMQLAATNLVRFELQPQIFSRPPVLHKVKDFEAFIREQKQFAVGGVLGPPDFVETTAYMVRPDTPGSRRLAGDPYQTRLVWSKYHFARGPERLRQVVTTNFASSITTIFLRDANFQDTARLMDKLQAYAKKEFTPSGIQLAFAGDVAVSQSLIAGIVNTQVTSLSFSVLTIFVLIAILKRSILAGIYCVIPSALAVLVNFAIMGWSGMPLGVATSMFSAMTLGLGVDFAIHLLEQFELIRSRGVELYAAIVESVSSIARPLFTNALGVALGFGVLMLSQVPANARLGALIVLGIGNCLLASLLILPILLRLKSPRFS